MEILKSTPPDQLAEIDNSDAIVQYGWKNSLGEAGTCTVWTTQHRAAVHYGGGDSHWGDTLGTYRDDHGHRVQIVSLDAGGALYVRECAEPYSGEICEPCAQHGIFAEAIETDDPESLCADCEADARTFVRPLGCATADEEAYVYAIRDRLLSGETVGYDDINRVAPDLMDRIITRACGRLSDDWGSGYRMGDDRR